MADPAMRTVWLLETVPWQGWVAGTPLHPCYTQRLTDARRWPNRHSAEKDRPALQERLRRPTECGRVRLRPVAHLTPLMCPTAKQLATEVLNREITLRHAEDPLAQYHGVRKLLLQLALAVLDENKSEPRFGTTIPQEDTKP